MVGVVGSSPIAPTKIQKAPVLPGAFLLAAGFSCDRISRLSDAAIAAFAAM
jgi:hypothetical protein